MEIPRRIQLKLENHAPWLVEHLDMKKKWILAWTNQSSSFKEKVLDFNIEIAYTVSRSKAKALALWTPI